MGLVSKGRRERQLKSAMFNSKKWEANKELTYKHYDKIVCCGYETTGIMKDGAMVCPICLKRLTK